MRREELAQWLERATTALADIATMPDAQMAQAKAQRVYEEIRAVWHGPDADDDAPSDPEE